jgi:hypothetical protein
MLILVLAANTAYADFPRLASIVARDGYLPRQFTNQGDRLAFSNGIVVLSVFAAVLLIVFKGDTHLLIPLYMIGVFISFTLSQTGMVVHWRRLREPGWRTSAFVNGIGAIATGVVLVIVAVTKVTEGAWIIIVLIPILVAHFKATHRHYKHAAAQLSLKDWEGEGPPAQHGPGADKRRASRRTSGRRLRTQPVRGRARRLRGQRRRGDRARPGRLGAVGQRHAPGSPPFAVPVADGAAAGVHRSGPDAHPTTTSPSSCRSSCRRWWQHLLHNQRALLIKGALLFRPASS